MPKARPRLPSSPLLWGLAAAWIALLGAAPASQASPQAVILVADKLAVEDFEEFPDALAPLSDKLSFGAAGMMNVRTGASANSANGYLSLAAGVRAAAGEWAGLALAPEESHQGIPAGWYYESLTGSPAQGSLLHLGAGELEQKGTGGAAGGAQAPLLLGGMLARAGLVTALLGDADFAGERRRYGALLVMDEKGAVPLGGAAGGLLQRDPAFPGGLRTDYGRLKERLAELFGAADVIAVELGDLARLEEAAKFLSREQARRLRRESLERMAAFVSSLLEGDASRARIVYLVAPSPSTMLGRAGILITPAFRWRIEPAPSREPAGLLTSATTRRPGIVANTDFLPTVLSDLGVKPPAAYGRPWQAVSHPRPLDALIRRYGEIKHVHRQRLPVIQPYFFAVLGLVILGTSAIPLARLGLLREKPRWAGAWRLFMTAFLAFPAALVILPFFPPAPLAGTWALTAALCLALTLLSALAGGGRELGPLGILGTLTVLLLCADILAGAPLMQKSLLGYDPVAGSRYYGIGNEYMGVLIGAGFVSSAWLLGAARARTGKAAWLPALLFAALALLMLHPRLGVNVGGAISAAAAAVLSYTFASRGRLSARHLAGFAIAIAALLIAAAYLDAYVFGDEASHLGQLMKSAQESGADPLWSVFGRKIAVNWRLIRLTVWSRVVFAAFAMLAVTAFVPNAFGRELGRRFPPLFEMTKAAIGASLVALAVNDSGVVAASTLLLWPLLAVLAVTPSVLPAVRAS